MIEYKNNKGWNCLLLLKNAEGEWRTSGGKEGLTVLFVSG